MIKTSDTIQSPVGHGPLESSLLDAWFELNYRLQEEALDIHINLRFVEQWLRRLCIIVSPRPECFWLFWARITELALVCASRYVDCCEVGAADELLVRPSRVLLRVEGERSNVSKDKGGLITRGRECTPVEQKARPMLWYLYDLLKGSGYMTEDYLLSLSRRAEKVIQVAGMLAGLGIRNSEEISIKLSCMDVNQRRSFRSRLCLFDYTTFNELGRALHLFMLHGNVDDKYVGKYLRG
jgi:predicted transcriptional regulator with HTH domain